MSQLNFRDRGPARCDGGLRNLLEAAAQICRSGLGFDNQGRESQRCGCQNQPTQSLMTLHETYSVFISDGSQIVVVISLMFFAPDATPTVDPIQDAFLPIHAMFAKCFTQRV
ncbi:MAG TPA: hypothetical protein VIU34_34220, partial [Steroidobacter sp.]